MHGVSIYKEHAINSSSGVARGVLRVLEHPFAHGKLANLS